MITDDIFQIGDLVTPLFILSIIGLVLYAIYLVIKHTNEDYASHLKKMKEKEEEEKKNGEKNAHH